MAPQPTVVSVKPDGMDLRLRLDACHTNMAGEFAGNVEVQIGCDPDLLGILVQHLRLGVTGEPQDGVIATRSTEEGVVVGFHSETLLALDEIPGRFCLFWEDERIGELDPQIVGSVPIERVHPLIDASQIRANPRTPASSQVRIVGARRPLLFFPALILGVCGALFVSAQQPFGADGGPAHQMGGLALLVLAAVLAAAELLISHREVWYERDRRRLSVRSRNRLSGARDLGSAEHYDLGDFEHVRIFEMSSWDSDHQAHSRWSVSLEGPVRYASEDGTVHRRSDALQLRSCSSHRAARRVAAEAAHHTGLRILDTGTRTA